LIDSGDKMDLFWKETITMIKALPPDKRLKVIDGLTKDDMQLFSKLSKSK